MVMSYFSGGGELNQLARTMTHYSVVFVGVGIFIGCCCSATAQKKSSGSSSVNGSTANNLRNAAESRLGLANFLLEIWNQTKQARKIAWPARSSGQSDGTATTGR
jgi:hypothetical protein